MIPNVADALVGWTQPVLLKTVSKTTVDFQPVVIVTGATIEAVVQPTKKTLLNADTLDWSRSHFTFHSAEAMELGQLIEYKGKDYKVIELADYSDYGYFEAVGEHTKTPVETVTP